MHGTLRRYLARLERWYLGDRLLRIPLRRQLSHRGSLGTAAGAAAGVFGRVVQLKLMLPLSLEKHV